MSKYGDYKKFKEMLLNKRIIKWDRDTLILEDGVEITIEMSEYDCCAYAHGNFKDVKLDALITDVSSPIISEYEHYGEVENKAKVTIYHNQNPIAVADFEASHNGYYYCVASFVVKGVHYKVVEA